MKNIPKKIYLQIDDDGETPEDFSELYEVSWCADKINKNDIEYKRSKPTKPQTYTLQEVEEAFKAGFGKGRDKGQGERKIDPDLAFIFHMQHKDSLTNKENG